MENSETYQRSNAVETFLNLGGKYYAYYGNLTKKVEEMCKETLKNHGIQCNVTSRVKTLDSLRKKLDARQQKYNRTYQEEIDITNDITDIAGVRIALYWPKDKTSVPNALASVLQIKRNKIVSDNDQNQEGTERVRRFKWYSADHYIVGLNPDDLGDTWKSIDNIEIQVVSVLRNALAQVEHDTVYKPQSGPPSWEEHNIIDGLSGAIHMGECFLDQLWDSKTRKLDGAPEPFENIYELGSCLSRFVWQTFGKKDDDLGSLRPLMPLLELKSLNSPLKLKKLLGNLKSKSIQGRYGAIKPSMSVRIMDHILFQNEPEEQKKDTLRLMPKEGLQKVYSTFIWLDELFSPATVWQEILLSKIGLPEHSDYFECFKWLGLLGTRKVFDESRGFSNTEIDKLRTLWHWFDRHPERPIQLAFRLCKLNIIRDIENEWHLFERAFAILGDIVQNA